MGNRTYLSTYVEASVFPKNVLQYIEAYNEKNIPEILRISKTIDWSGVNPLDWADYSTPENIKNIRMYDIPKFWTTIVYNGKTMYNIDGYINIDSFPMVSLGFKDDIPCCYLACFNLDELDEGKYRFITSIEQASKNLFHNFVNAKNTTCLLGRRSYIGHETMDRIIASLCLSKDVKDKMILVLEFGEVLWGDYGEEIQPSIENVKKYFE